MRQEFLPAGELNRAALLDAIERGFNQTLPGGLYFDVELDDDGYRVGVLEDAGCCSVKDWRYDQIRVSPSGCPDLSGLRCDGLRQAVTWLTQE